MPVLQRDFPLKQTSTKTDHGKQTAYLVKYHWHHLPKCTMLYVYSPYRGEGVIFTQTFRSGAFALRGVSYR